MLILSASSMNKLIVIHDKFLKCAANLAVGALKAWITGIYPIKNYQKIILFS